MRSRSKKIKYKQNCGNCLWFYQLEQQCRRLSPRELKGVVFPHTYPDGYCTNWKKLEIPFL